MDGLEYCLPQHRLGDKTLQTLNYQNDFNQFIQFYGRHKKTTSGHAFYYTASGFSFGVSGSFIKLVFQSYYEEENKKAYIVISFGKTEETYALNLGETEITINLEQMEMIYVYKRSESMMSRSELVSLETDGTFYRYESTPKPLKITFIGDSLTCGYGNLSNNTEIPFSTLYEDGLKSYASIAAKMLNADYEIISVSGIGLYKSIYANVTMPSIYEQYDIYDITPYPFDKKEDIVILNIGTNDNSYMKFLVEPTRIVEEKNFLQAYIKFILRLRVLHPKAIILAISQGERQTFVDDLIKEAVSMTNDPMIKHFRVSPIEEKDGMGQQYHPTVITHERWGMELAEYIKKMRK